MKRINKVLGTLWSKSCHKFQAIIQVLHASKKNYIGLHAHRIYHDNYLIKACLDGILPSSVKPSLDDILPSSVSNLRGDYHNPLPAKLVHTRKINLRRLVDLLENSLVALW